MKLKRKLKITILSVLILSAIISNLSILNIKSLNKIKVSQELQWNPEGVRIDMDWYVNVHKFCKISTDGQGGVFLVWQHYQYQNIVGQYLNSDGINQWEGDTHQICAKGHEQRHPVICYDGQDGAIVVWNDYRNGYYENYAQRINRNGIKLWEENGIPVCPGFQHQYGPQICSDGEGGIIVVWFDQRDIVDQHYVLRTQRINSDGELLWQNEGVPISGDTDMFNADLQIFSDGQGGAIIAWQSRRYTVHDLYVQKINMNGEVQWGELGMRIAIQGSEANDDFHMSTDYNGGVIISWSDDYNGREHVYVQRVNKTGGIQWENDGVLITANRTNASELKICTDEGGTFILWQDDSNLIDFRFNIYSQRINMDGIIQWKEGGIPICPNNDLSQYSPVICSDGQDEAIIIWEQRIEGHSYTNLLMQKINVNGEIQWEENGVPIYTIDDYQNYAQIFKNELNEYIIVWDDDRRGYWDIYAQKIYDDDLQTDINAPITEISFIPYSGSNIILNTTEFSLMATDGEDSGVSSINYKINNTDWLIYNEPFTLGGYPPNNLYNISYYSIDNAGNEEEIKWTIVCLVYEDTGEDIDPPYTELNFIPYLGTNIVLNITQFTLTSIDVGSGVSSINYKINNTDWMVYDSPFYLSGYFLNNLYNISYYAIDNYGNEENVKWIIVSLIEESIEEDLDAPYTEIQFTPYSGTNVVIDTTEFTLLSTDGDGSGVASTYYKLNNSDWMVYNGPFSLIIHVPNRFYEISYYSIDNAGNEEIIKSTIVFLLKEENSIPGYDILIIFGVFALIFLGSMKKKIRKIQQ